MEEAMEVWEQGVYGNACSLHSIFLQATLKKLILIKKK